MLTFNFADPWNIIMLSLIAFFLLLTIIFSILILIRKKKRKKKKEYDDKINQILDNVGGLDNIKESTCNLSRLALVLNDYSLVNKEELIKLGVSGMVTSTKKITLVIGALSKEIDEVIKLNSKDIKENN